MKLLQAIIDWLLRLRTWVRGLQGHAPEPTDAALVADDVREQTGDDVGIHMPPEHRIIVTPDECCTRQATDDAGTR